MHKKAFWAHLLCGVGAVLLLALVIGQFFQLRALQDAVNALGGQVESYDSRLRSEISQVERGITARLEDQESLFTQQSSSLSYEEGRMVVQVTVTPKEVRAGEELFLAVGAAQPAPMELRGADYTGAITLPLAAEYVLPVVQFLGEQGRRQETLAPLDTRNLLFISYNASFGGEVGNIPVGPDEWALVLTANEVYGVQALRAAVPVLTVREETSGAVEEVVMTRRADSTYDAMFTADMSSFTEKDNKFTVRLAVTTPDGLVYELVEDFASFERDDRGGGNGSYLGSGTLEPRSPVSIDFFPGLG